MAYTVTRKNVNLGSVNGALCSVTADAASGTVPTGLGSIQSVAIAPQSMNSSNIKFSVSAGTVTVSGCTSGDAFFLTIFGN